MIVTHDPKAVKANWKHLKELFKKFGTMDYPRLVEYGHLKIEKNDDGSIKPIDGVIE